MKPISYKKDLIKNYSFSAPRFFILFILLMQFTNIQPCHSQDFPPQILKETHEISGLVLSPFCPGRTLNDCPSSSASEMRNKISQELVNGKSKDEILNQIYKSYGDEIRAMPKKEGFGLLAWLSPIGFLLIGIAVVYIWLSKHSPAENMTEKTLDISPEMKKRIEDEILK